MDKLSSEQVIIIFILVCTFMLLWSLWKGPLLTILAKIILGVLMIYIGNYIIPSLELGINYITLGICTILGIPGLVMLYIINSLL